MDNSEDAGGFYHPGMRGVVGEGQHIHIRSQAILLLPLCAIFSGVGTRFIANYQDYLHRKESSLIMNSANCTALRAVDLRNYRTHTRVPLLPVSWSLPPLVDVP